MANGWIEKRPDGKYRIRYRMCKGGPFKSETVGNRKRDAEDLLDKRRREALLGIKEIDTCRVDEFAEQWITNYIREPEYAKSTVLNYKLRLSAHIVPAFGKKTFEDIQPENVRMFVSRLLSQGLATGTVNAILNQLKVFFRHAREANLLSHDPCEGVSIKVRRRHKEQHFLTVPQVYKLADAIDRRYRTLVLIAALTGLRMGELFGLQWQYVDLEKKQLRVRYNVSYGELAEPKTEASKRTVFLSDEAVKIFKEQKLATGKNKGQIWTAPSGGLLNKDNFRERFYIDARDAAGLDGVRFHDLRHTFVAFMIEVGMGKNPLFIQRTLGHAKISTTFDVYGHLFPSAEDEARVRLDELIRDRNTPKSLPLEEAK